MLGKYLPTKLGDLCWANIYLQNWVIYVGFLCWNSYSSTMVRIWVMENQQKTRDKPTGIFV